MPESVWEYRNHNEGECIIFDGWKSKKQYCYVWIDGKIVRAHRQAWIEANGPIPEGMTVDHVCYRRDCINTEHLRLLSHSENTKLSRTNIARRAKTRCPQGHPYDGNNTYIDKRGSRYCKTCLADRDKETQAKKKELRHKSMEIRKLKCRNKLHDMTLENTRVLPSGSRQCIECARARTRNWNRNHNK